MALHLVPYTNAMRLGQGFNSYTQQICVDDAVVINNDRAENTLLNDGTTMRILIQSQGKASAWTRQKEVVTDDRTIGLEKEPLQILPEDELNGAVDEGKPAEAEVSPQETEPAAAQDDAADKSPEDQPEDKPEDQPKDQQEEEAPSPEPAGDETAPGDEAPATDESTSPVVVEAESPQEAAGETTEETTVKDTETPEATTEDTKPTPSESAKTPTPKRRVRSASVGTSKTTKTKPSTDLGKPKATETVAVPPKKPTVPSEDERVKEVRTLEGAVPLYDSETEKMEPDETAAFTKCIELDPSLGEHLQVTAAVGGGNKTAFFNNLDFVREDWHIKVITIKVGQGIVRSASIEYTNGLTVQRGMANPSGKTFRLGPFESGERVTTAMIESGIWISTSGEYNRSLLGIRFYTNRGRSMLAEASESKPTGDDSAVKDGYEYTNISTATIDCPLKGGTLKGFFGHGNDNGVFRLGLIWGDVLPEAPATTVTTPPKVDRRILPSKWGQTTSVDLQHHKARFGITYSAPPQVIYAFSEARGGNIDPRPPSWDHMSAPAITTEEFNYTTSSSVLQELNYSWMTLPNNEVNFNTRSHDFEGEIQDGTENASGSFQVTFAKPYKTTPAQPAIWCITLDYTGGPNVKPNARLRARVEDLTTTGFKLIVETWDGGMHAGNVWGWCVWDKEYDNVKVKAGTTSFDNGSLTRGNLKYWEPDFGSKKPVSIMTGIRGFNINISDPPGRFNAKSQYQGTLDNGCIAYGVDSSAMVQWMEVVYVAILEN